MLKMLTVLIFCLLRYTCGFLLGNGNSSIPGKQMYLNTSEFYTDQAKLKQEMISNMASHGDLTHLAFQIQSKLDAFEQKLLTQASTSTSQTSVAELEQKYKTLEQKNNVLEQALVSKEREIMELKQNLIQEMTKVQKLTEDMTHVQMQTHVLGNQTANLQQKIEDLEHLKCTSINHCEVQTLHNITQLTQTLVNQVHALESTEQARNQDFIALYNKVNSLEMEGKSTGSLVRNHTASIGKQKMAIENLEKTTSMKLANITNQQTTAMKKLENRTQTDLDLNQRLQNNSLNNLQQYIDGQLQPVILTACNDTTSWTVEHLSLLTFPNILTSVGVPDQIEAHFNQTGRFRCPIAGYYYVTTTIESLTDNTIIAIVVNAYGQHYQYVTGKTGGTWTSGTTGVTLHLNTGDEVWIRHYSSTRKLYQSCFTIFKIK